MRIPVAVVLVLLAMPPASADPLLPAEQRTWAPKTAATVDVRHLRALTAGESLLLVVSNHLGGDVRPIMAVFDAGLDERWSVNLLDARFRDRIEALEMADGNLLLAGTSGHSVIVQARARQDGALLWQHEFAAAHFGPGTFALPAIAQSLVTGEVFVAVSDDGTVRLQVIAADGTAQLPVELPALGGVVHTPDRLLALAGGGLALTTITGAGGTDGYHSAILDADGELVATDFEAGAIGHVFTRALSVADAHGGLHILGGLETTCGLSESRLWRLAPDGTRLWTYVDPPDPCLWTSPVGWAAAPDDGVYVGSHRAQSFGLQRIEAGGGLAWGRDWPGLPDGGSLNLRAVAGNTAFEVLMAGQEAVPGSGGPWRPVAVIHDADGRRCAEGTLGESGTVSGAIAQGDRWLLAVEMLHGPLMLSLHDAPAHCSATGVFSDGFEAPQKQGPM